MVYCVRCAAEVLGEAEFCWKCGTSLYRPAAVAPSQPSPSPALVPEPKAEQPKRKRAPRSMLSLVQDQLNEASVGVHLTAGSSQDATKVRSQTYR